MYCDVHIDYMNPSLVLKAIQVISKGSYSIDEFAVAAGLGKNITEDLLGFLREYEIGMMTSEKVEFRISDKVKASVLAIQMGADPEDISKFLTWKDFELLARIILDKSGYIAEHEFRMKRPRYEIDVVGIKDSLALLIDCKHWKRCSPSALERFASMQVKRAQAFLALQNDLKYVVPIILTLHSESIVNVKRVPVVPIIKFRAFLNEISGYLDEFRVVHV